MRVTDADVSRVANNLKYKRSLYNILVWNGIGALFPLLLNRQMQASNTCPSRPPRIG